ncbi:MAG: phytanoyl-CoA dioxygenase family protein [Myxococcaceae bacterium]
MELAEALMKLSEDGYARLGPVLSDEGIFLLRERAEELMLGKVVYPGLFFQLDAESGQYKDAPLGLGWQGPSLSYRKLEKLEKDERFREWLQNPLFERIARERIGPGAVVIYRSILFNKNAQGGSEIPWHQDGGKLWGLTEDPELQIWTALDDAPEGGGCLEVVPGTHRLGLASALGGVVPAGKVAEEHADQRAIPVPVKAGEVVLLHNQVWHRSGKSRVGQRRLAFSVCYMSGRVRCLRKRHAPRVFFEAFGPA